MNTPTWRRPLVALLVSMLLLAACGGGGNDDNGGAGQPEPTGAGETPALPECPLDALTDAQKPVRITFWHQLVAENADVLEQIVDDFHASQDDVRVRLDQYPDYQELFTKWRAGLNDGSIPDIANMEETKVQPLIDSEATLPAQSCVDAADYDTSDFLPAALDYYTTEGVLRALPFTISNPILIYNRTAFAQAGLDPDDPPDTLDEVREYSQRIVDSGTAPHGMSLKIEPFINEFWYAKAGEVYVNNGNGRDARATEANFDSDTGVELWTWWREMVDDGLLLNVGSTPDPDNLLALGNGEAAMTVDASAALGPIFDVLGTGQFEGLELGTGPLPGLRPDGGVPVGDGSVWISALAPPERQAAAWRFATYLNEPAVQAKLHVGTGYVPTRESAVEDPAVQALWADRPAFRVAYDQLLGGPRDEATAGSVIGDYEGVREAVRTGLTLLLSGDATPEEALARTQQLATDAIQAYNERIGM